MQRQLMTPDQSLNYEIKATHKQFLFKALLYRYLIHLPLIKHRYCYISITVVEGGKFKIQCDFEWNYYFGIENVTYFFCNHNIVFVSLSSRINTRHKVKIF